MMFALINNNFNVFTGGLQGSVSFSWLLLSFTAVDVALLLLLLLLLDLLLLCFMLLLLLCSY
jgi:hypothetical protein